MSTYSPDNQPKDGKDWLHRLKAKWKVQSVLQVIIILCTFAIGGSLCGYLGKRIIGFLAIENDVLWGVLYFVLITLLWPLCVLLVSIPLGQFSFFKNYISKIAKRMSGR